MTIAVTTTIKGILKTRDKEIALGVDSVLALLDEVRDQIVTQLATGATGYSALHMKQTLNSIESYLSNFESAANRTLGAGIAAQFAAGSGLVTSALQAGGESGIFFGMGHISGNLIDSLQEFAFSRIRKLSSDAFTRIKGELTLGTLGQKTPQEVASVIAGNLNGPSIFKTVGERAEVITGLEMGRAFSMATDKAIGVAAETLLDLLRMWLHAGHPRAPRQVHLLMHGQVRGMKNPFYRAKDNTPVMYPRDPGAPIQEVIRCGCTHVPYMERWGNQQDFADAFDATAFTVSQRHKTRG
jgi:hypothetical protein